MQQKSVWFSFENKQNVDTLQQISEFKLHDCPVDLSTTPLFELNKNVDLDHLSINILAALNVIAKEEKLKINNLEICTRFNEFLNTTLIYHLDAMKEFDIINSIISYVKPTMLVFKV